MADREVSPAALLARARERERAQPRPERRADGQFSTPVPIVRALVRWAVRPDAGAATTGDGAPRVLDPATGGGLFALAAVERLRDLGAESGEPAAVTAVESDTAALSQARTHLPDGVETVGADFLSLGPDDLGRFDAVVGNPPYVRQEGVGEDARAHLAAFGPEGSTPYRDGDRAIDRRSDAYVYFLTNATRLLRPGGRLGVVVPTKWLATRYGEPLQRFLLAHYDLRAVVGFEDRAFEDALVDAALLCAERVADPAAASGPTRFCRLAECSPAALDGVVGRASSDGVGSAGPSPSRDLSVPRSRLERQVPGKLAHLLDAPAGTAALLADDALVPLGELATPTYGHKTGANDLFFDPDVDERFRAPAVTSFRAVDGLAVERAPATVLDVHDYVRRVERGEAPADPAAHGDLAAATLAALDADGYDRTADYLRSGAEYADRATCAARRVWFDLGPLDRPPVLHPKFFDERVAVVHNRADCVPSNAIDCLAVADDVGVPALLGALNATLHALALECWGRAEGGGALQLMTYELSRVPVLDVRRVDAGTRERLADGFRALAVDEDGARDDLDAAVASALDGEWSPGALREQRATLVRRRRE